MVFGWAEKQHKKSRNSLENTGFFVTPSKNYMFQRDVAHDEYEVKRIFDSGVAELLFPFEIYHLDMKLVKDKLLRWFRSQIEEF